MNRIKRSKSPRVRGIHPEDARNLGSRLILQSVAVSMHQKQK